ncbi:hypothetical protein OKN36_20640 [Furfurilactobacillus sp. OKN36]
MIKFISDSYDEGFADHSQCSKNSEAGNWLINRNKIQKGKNRLVKGF